MDVSVIITAYNVERYIRRAIESALRQQNVTLEIIVVDDASTDGTWNHISAHSDPRIKPLRLKANTGPAAARNAGLAVATGNWIAILDGDDAFEPGRLARCLTLAARQNADIVVDNLMVNRETDGKAFPMFPPEIFSKLDLLDAAIFIKGTLSKQNNYTLGYVKPIFSHHFLKQHRLSYDSELRIGEDYQFMLEALLLGARCAIEQTAGYYYTARTSSISYRLSRDNITRIMQADARLLARYTLDNAAAMAQAKRTRLLKKEYAYTQLIETLKKKDWYGSIKTILSNPACLWLMHRPLNIRIKRLYHCHE